MKTGAGELPWDGSPQPWAPSKCELVPAWMHTRGCAVTVTNMFVVSIPHLTRRSELCVFGGGGGSEERGSCHGMGALDNVTLLAFLPL